MRRSVLVLLISGISTGAVASGYALWSYASGDRAERVAATAIAPSTKPAAGPAVAALMPPAALPPGTSALLAIEVARIDAGGPSVLAGRSPPNHKVTLLANGREIATVTATDEGQWSAIINEGIAAGPLELSIVSQPKDGGAVVRGAARQIDVPAPAPSLATAAPSRPQPVKSAAADSKGPAPRAASQPDTRVQPPAPVHARSDEAANKRALAEFEALVERTRKEMAGQQPASAPAKADSSRDTAVAVAPQGAQARAPASSTSTLAAPAQAPTSRSASETRLAATIPPASPPSAASATHTQPAPASAAVPAPIPVPITFVTGEASLTQDGARAASLLAEYVRLKRPAGIALSGHADARGPDGYNMRLSLRRLEAIQRYLRAAGYSGELSLIPRGKREPYAGIDRKRLSRNEIYQADRRVELRLTP
jgi:outer membrane protein OmpA-like peptidoglycan-associated protein